MTESQKNFGLHFIEPINIIPSRRQKNGIYDDILNEFMESGLKYALVKEINESQPGLLKPKIGKPITLVTQLRKKLKEHEIISIHVWLRNNRVYLESLSIQREISQKNQTKIPTDKESKIPSTKNEMIHLIEQEAKRHGYDLSKVILGSRERHLFFGKSPNNEIRGEIRETGKMESSYPERIWVGIYMDSYKFLKELNDNSQCFVVILDYLFGNFLVIPLSEISKWYPYNHGMSFIISRKNTNYFLGNKLLSNKFINRLEPLFVPFTTSQNKS